MTCLFDLDGVKALHIVMAAGYPRCSCIMGCENQDFVSLVCKKNLQSNVF